MPGTLPHDIAELSKLSAKRVDQLGALANQQIARSENNCGCLSLRTLARDETHRRPLRRCAASQIASASAMSFFCRFTNGFTYAGAISLVSCPNAAISRAQ